MKITIEINKLISHKKKIKKLDKFLAKMAKNGFSECNCKDYGVEHKDHLMHAYNSGILQGTMFGTPIYKIYFYCNKK